VFVGNTCATWIGSACDGETGSTIARVGIAISGSVAAKGA
jgi:hypothetical protein